MVYEINIRAEDTYKHMFVIENGFIICKKNVTIIYEKTIYTQEKIKLNEESYFFVMYNKEFYKIQL